MSDITAKPAIPRAATRTRATAEQRRRKRAIQITLGLLLLIPLVLLGVWAQRANPRGAYVWIIGLAFGYVLQRSRFCFTASLRDPMLTGGTNLTKAVIVSLAVATVGFVALQMARFGMSLENLDMTKMIGHVRPVSPTVALGAFLFGIGAVIAGGCASGTVMRMGEGFAQQWLAFVFFVFGSILGLFLTRFFGQVPVMNARVSVYLPTALGGWLPAAIVQFAALAALYALADRWGKKKVGAL